VTKVKRKPQVNQVDLTDCCVIPKDLAEFAKVHNIDLRQHSDPAGNKLSILCRGTSVDDSRALE
jgi:glutamate--cysteine ligase regulatory subunit